MGLLFHSGFETGDFTEWGSTTGSPEVQSTIKKTGTYAMRCNIDYSTATGPISIDNFSGSFYLLVSIAPTSSIHLTYVSCQSNTLYGAARIKLSNELKVGFVGSGGAVSYGTTILSLDTWYRLSWYIEAVGYIRLYLNGMLELGPLTVYTHATNQDCVVGIDDTAYGADLYFDDIVISDSKTEAPGDIRVLRSSPKADGTNQGFDTAFPAGARPWYDRVNECPFDAANSYVQRAGAGELYETYNLQDKADLGIGVSDTIQAVNKIGRAHV